MGLRLKDRDYAGLSFRGGLAKSLSHARRVFAKRCVPMRRDHTSDEIRRLGWSTRLGFKIFFFLLTFAVVTVSSNAALPKRLVLLLDGVSYRDVKALQEGIHDKSGKNPTVCYQAFHRSYFPVSRLVSTFPSISDPAWSEILGNAPPPGYQRTYFDSTNGMEVSLNGITSLVEYEQQMTGPLDSNFRRVMSYLFPLSSFKQEISALTENFFKSSGDVTNYYALIHATDVAQHLTGDIRPMLCALDEKLEELRAIYRKREGRELEILMLSDHANNHAGVGKRLAIGGFLKRAGYRVTKSIRDSKDVVLPTAGIESWVEVHNAPEETENLVTLLTHLEGVELLTARDPKLTNRFIVVSARGERAAIDWHPEKDLFRYSVENGDPIGYQPVQESLAKANELDADGFATADDWMKETFAHHYPVALERIVRGHTQIAQNPATILISLKNEYVHCDWLIRKGIILVSSGGTHGGLDDINSNGILLSNFVPTQDTTTSRVAGLFEGFEGRRNNQRFENGARWISDVADLALSKSVRWTNNAAKQRLLQIWTPSFAWLNAETPIDVVIERAGPLMPAQLPRIALKSRSSKKMVTIHRPLSVPDGNPYERIYAFPPQLALTPRADYQISGKIRGEGEMKEIFKFTFRTDPHGVPMLR